MHDVAEVDRKTPVAVVATSEDGVQVVRSEGAPIEIERSLDGERMAWQCLGFTAKTGRIGEPDATPPDRIDDRPGIPPSNVGVCRAGLFRQPVARGVASTSVGRAHPRDNGVTD